MLLIEQMKLIYTILIGFSISLCAAQGTLQEFLDENILSEGINYESLSDSQDAFSSAMAYYLKQDYQKFTQAEKTAFLINAYNLIVLREAAFAYPVSSVKELANFFDKQHAIGNTSLSLNAIEDLVFQVSNNADVHFALVCGARSCPTLSNTLFTAENLDLELQKRKEEAMKTEHIIQLDKKNTTLLLNQIFSWFSSDFDGDPKTYLSNSLQTDLSEYSINYLEYDWALNDVKKQKLSRYIATRLYDKGQYELHLFNNYYTQKETGEREENNFGRHNFYSSLFALTYGLNSRANIGLGIKMRSANQDITTTSGVFKALRFKNQGILFHEEDEGIIGYNRSGITGIYPFIKYAPFASISNLSITHTLTIPIGSELEGNAQNGFIDWDGISINNQLFYTKPFSTNKEWFFDIGIHFENLGKHIYDGDESGYTQLSLPFTSILNVFPNQRFTYYGLINLTPRYGISYGDSTNYSFDPFAQVGAGIKYFVLEKLELELLYTSFLNTTENRTAHTFNIGLRYINR